MNRDKDIVLALGGCWHEMVRDSDSHYITCSCGEVSKGIRAFFLHAQENNPDFTSDAGKVHKWNQ